MRKFPNEAGKAKVVLSVFKEGERLKVRDIVERVRKSGYKAEIAALRMFIHHNMLYKYLKRERVNGVNYYLVDRGFLNRA